MLFHAELVDADLRIGLPGAQYRRGEIVVVGAVGELLRFERQRLAVALRLAVFADALAVEEVAAVNLQSGLVAQHLDGTSRGGFSDRGDLLDAAFGLAVDHPVVVVAAGSL